MWLCFDAILGLGTCCSHEEGRKNSEKNERIECMLWTENWNVKLLNSSWRLLKLLCVNAVAGRNTFCARFIRFFASTGDIVSDKNVFLIGRSWVLCLFVDHKLGFHNELSHFFFLASLTSKWNEKKRIICKERGLVWIDVIMKSRKGKFLTYLQLQQK